MLTSSRHKQTQMFLTCSHFHSYHHHYFKKTLSGCVQRYFWLIPYQLQFKQCRSPVFITDGHNWRMCTVKCCFIGMYSEIKVHLIQKKKKKRTLLSHNDLLISISRQPFIIRKTPVRMMSAVVKSFILRDRGDFCLAGRNWGLIFNHTTHSNCREHAVTELETQRWKIKQGCTVHFSWMET